MFENFLGGKVRRMDRQQKNDKTERARGLGRKTREEVGKGNQMTALRFQTGSEIRHPPASLWGSKTKSYLTLPTLQRAKGTHCRLCNTALETAVALPR